MANINRVTISGNLTKDPELRQLPSGNSVCKLRMAVNTRVKDRDSGQSKGFGFVEMSSDAEASFLTRLNAVAGETESLLDRLLAPR